MINDWRQKQNHKVTWTFPSILFNKHWPDMNEFKYRPTVSIKNFTSLCRIRFVSSVVNLQIKLNFILSASTIQIHLCFYFRNATRISYFGNRPPQLDKKF